MTHPETKWDARLFKCTNVINCGQTKPCDFVPTAVLKSCRPCGLLADPQAVGICMMNLHMKGKLLVIARHSKWPIVHEGRPSRSAIEVKEFLLHQVVRQGLGQNLDM